MSSTDNVSTSDKLEVGHLVAGRYEIKDTLGVGGMGSVYLAKDRILGGDPVALKALHKHLVYDKTYTQRFLREVQIMRRISHKNVIRTFDVGTDNDLVYFTMEYAPGHNLVELMREMSFSLEQLRDIMKQTCEGLSAIHDENVIHRDIKPENLIVMRDGTVKITDFGVARPETSHLTQHNEVIGSAAYMAPELWRGDNVSHKIDLYSLGIIFYELCCGELPFKAETPPQMMNLHLDQKPVPPKKKNSKIPQSESKLIMKLLEKDPELRPKNAQEVVSLIEATIRTEKNKNKEQDEEITEKIDTASHLSELEKETKAHVRESSVAKELPKKKTRKTSRKTDRKVQTLSSYEKKSKLGALVGLVPTFILLLTSGYFLNSNSDFVLSNLSINSSDSPLLTAPLAVVFYACIPGMFFLRGSLKRVFQTLVVINLIFLILTVSNSTSLIKNLELASTSFSESLNASLVQLSEVVSLKSFHTGFKQVVLSDTVMIEKTTPRPFYGALSGVLSVLYLAFLSFIIKAHYELMFGKALRVWGLFFCSTLGFMFLDSSVLGSPPWATFIPWLLFFLSSTVLLQLVSNKKK